MKTYEQVRTMVADALVNANGNGFTFDGRNDVYVAHDLMLHDADVEWYYSASRNYDAMTYRIGVIRKVVAEVRNNPVVFSSAYQAKEG